MIIKVMIFFNNLIAFFAEITIIIVAVDHMLRKKWDGILTISKYHPVNCFDNIRIFERRMMGG